MDVRQHRWFGEMNLAHVEKNSTKQPSPVNEIVNWFEVQEVKV